MKLEVKFNDRYRVNDKPVSCSLHLEPGELTILIGENGIGKSSFIQFLKLAKHEFFGDKKAIFLDQGALRPLNGATLVHLRSTLERYRFEKNPLIKKYASIFSSIQDKEVRNLSGGENQLAKIYLTLFLSGDVFVLDEPVQFLDAANVEVLKEILKDLKLQGKALLVIEHRADLIAQLIDNKYTVLESMSEYRIEKC